MTLIEKLNKYECSFETSKEGVSLDAAPDDATLFNPDGFVVDEDFAKFLNESDHYEVWIDTHPADRRAGLVCFVEYKGETAWYDEVADCCWK